MGDAGNGPIRGQGTVKKWFGEKGFGFLVPQDGGEDIFVHRRALLNLPDLTEGDAVIFEASFDNATNKWKANMCSALGAGVHADAMGGGAGGAGGPGAGGKGGGKAGQKGGSKKGKRSRGGGGENMGGGAVGEAMAMMQKGGPPGNGLQNIGANPPMGDGGGGKGGGRGSGKNAGGGFGNQGGFDDMQGMNPGLLPGKQGGGGGGKSGGKGRGDSGGKGNKGGGGGGGADFGGGMGMMGDGPPMQHHMQHHMQQAQQMPPHMQNRGFADMPQDMSADPDGVAILPLNWVQLRGASGAFFVNRNTREVSQEMPLELRQMALQQQQPQHLQQQQMHQMQMQGQMDPQQSQMQGLPPQGGVEVKGKIGDFTICEDAQGIFYSDQRTGETFETPPPELVRLHQQQQQAQQQPPPQQHQQQQRNQMEPPQMYQQQMAAPYPGYQTEW